jgi:acyl-CoA reductase-like NAD-dependent aldehyde dehydrogenase
MNLPDYSGWQKLAADFEHQTNAFIGGDYVSSLSEKTYQTINPATEQVTAEMSACDSADIDMAVRYSRAAFNKGSWSRMADINLASTALKWYGEAIDKITDEIIATPDNVRATITREPMGVVGVVVPWNFPLLMACWKIAPALAAGNSVIVKPSEQTPQSILKLAELAIEAGIPDGVFNVVPGTGIEAGAALGRHNDVDCLTFTGSTAIGKKFLEYSGQSNMKAVWLECGGKNPNIVMADCPNMDKAVMNAAMNIFFNQGEVCAAASRLIVQESIRDEFVEKVAAIGKTRIPGDPLNPETNLGAIVDKGQFDRINGYIAKGQEEGANMTAHIIADIKRMHL